GSVPRKRAHVPSIADDGVTLFHDEPGAGVRGGTRIVGEGRVRRNAGELIQPGEAQFSAIVHIEQHPVIAVGQVDRLEYEEIHRILAIAGRVARWERNVGDDLVVTGGGSELAEGRAAQLLVLTDGAE